MYVGGGGGPAAQHAWLCARSKADAQTTSTPGCPHQSTLCRSMRAKAEDGRTMTREAFIDNWSSAVHTVALLAHQHASHSGRGPDDALEPLLQVGA